MEVFSSVVSKGLGLISKPLRRGVDTKFEFFNTYLCLSCARLCSFMRFLYQHYVLRLEQKISCYIRKWLKLDNSTTNVCFYSSVSPRSLSIESLTSVMKSTKVSDHLLLCESFHPCVPGTNIDLKIGNWKISGTVREAESTLEFKKIIVYHQSNRADFQSKRV